MQLEVGSRPTSSGTAAPTGLKGRSGIRKTLDFGATDIMSSPDRIDLAVSHNREASDVALRIVDSVEAQGFFAWADMKAFYSPLVSAEKQIARAFSKARVICLVVGGKYRDTQWCQEEYGLGRRAEEDLSIDRVITAYHGNAARLLIPKCLLGRPSFPVTNGGCQAIAEFLSALPDHSDALIRWSKASGARGDLLGRLPIAERTKLVVEHVEFLVEHFAKGHFYPGSGKHALRLGLIGTPASMLPTHLSPTLLMELAWKWVLEILERASVRCIIDSTQQPDVPALDIEIATPFLRLPGSFYQYLAIARERRTPPTNTEGELLSVVDHVLCGFSLLCARSGIDVHDAFRGVGDLLSLFSGSSPGVSRAAACLREHLPEIAYPENATQRRVLLYSLLRAS